MAELKAFGRIRIRAFAIAPRHARGFFADLL
jgi:hypothetical protein